jgi:two-component system LytT family response regulator/two-component system response regulator LytT
MSDTMTVLVVDDEELARARIAELLADIPGVVVVGEAQNGIEAVDQIDRLRPDVVILDIQMPGMNGFEVIEALSHLPLVIFATAYDEFAIKAFEVDSIDYLLKPISRERMATAVERARGLLERKPDLDAEIERLAGLVKSREVDRLPVMKGRKIVLVDMDEIVWIGTEDELVFVHTKSEKYLVNSTMAELEHRLKPGVFFRCHRSSIVNLNHVREIVPWFGGKYRIVVDDADRTELTLSRGRTKSLRDIMPW